MISCVKTNENSHTNLEGKPDNFSIDSNTLAMRADKLESCILQVKCSMNFISCTYNDSFENCISHIT